MPPIKKPKPQLGRTFLREWREYRDLSQETAADLLGISRPNLSKIENGAVPYSQPILEAAAVAYRCDVTDLLRYDPFKVGEAVDLLALLNAKTDAQREQAIRILKAALS